MIPIPPTIRANRSNRDKQNGESLAGVELGLNDVFRIPDIEIVFLFRPKMVAVAEYGGGFLARHLDRILRNGRAKDVVKPRNSFELLLRHRVGDDDRVILILSQKAIGLSAQA